MAVQEQTPQIEYVANGVTKSFPLTFDCEDQDHLIVTVNDAELSVGSWVLIDENVSFKVAPANGSNIVIQRNTPLQRTTTYKTYNNSFRPEPVNKDLDRIWWKLQELGLADWLLSKRLDKEIRDRIAADIYYYTLITKETDLKLTQLKSYIDKLINDANNKTDDLKKYIDALVNNIVGGEPFLPITDFAVETWSGRTQKDKNKDSVHMKDFGCKADGISNDTQFILDAIASGRALDWGDETCIYAIDSIVFELKSNLFWQSSGAIIKCRNYRKQFAIHITCNGFNITLSNTYVDANSSAFTAVRIENLSEATSNINLLNVTTENTFRSSTYYIGGDGISVIGNVNVFALNPTSRNIRMAKGAGIPGSQGVSGLTIARSNTIKDYYPKTIMVLNPTIENIYCDDNSYVMDQDGVRIFTNHSQDNMLPQPTAARLISGTYKNCMGRSIKCQSEIITVTDPTFIRTRNFDRGYGNHEIDCQVNGGLIRGIDAIYDGGRPDSLVMINSSSNILKNTGNGLCKVRDAKVTWKSEGQLSQTWLNLFQINTSNTVNPNVLIDDIEVRTDGVIGRFAFISGKTANPNDNLTLNITDSQAPIRDAVLNFSGDVVTKGKVDGFRNTRSQRALGARGDYVAKCEVNFMNCQNLVDATRDHPDDAFNALQTIGRVRPRGNNSAGGIIDHQRVRLPANSTVKVEMIGYNNFSHCVILSISHTRNSIAVLAVDNLGITMLSGNSATVSTGNTSEPTNGIYRVWVEGEYMMVKNTTDIVRHAILQQLG